MKIDFNAMITDIRGKPLNVSGGTYTSPGVGEQAEEQAELMTLGFVCFQALNNNMTQERKAEDFAARYELMLKVYGERGGGEQDVSAKQVTLIQALLPQLWSPLIVGRANDLLDPKEDNPA